jgi:hypothetical protein
MALTPFRWMSLHHTRSGKEPACLFGDGGEKGRQPRGHGAVAGEDHQPAADVHLLDIANGQGRVAGRERECRHEGDGAGCAHQLELNVGVVGPVAQVGLETEGPAGADDQGVVAGARGGRDPDLLAQRGNLDRPTVPGAGMPGPQDQLQGFLEQHLEPELRRPGPRMTVVLVADDQVQRAQPQLGQRLLELEFGDLHPHLRVVDLHPGHSGDQHATSR